MLRTGPRIATFSVCPPPPYHREGCRSTATVLSIDVSRALAMSFETHVGDLPHLLMYMLIKLSLFAAAFFAFLFWLFQPIVIENPGVAAYQPPPGTRLVPLPRKMDSPEVFEIHSAESPMVASVEDTKSKDSIIKKNNTRVVKPKQRQKTFPSYWYGERVIANARHRDWNGSRHNYWF